MTRRFKPIYLFTVLLVLGLSGTIVQTADAQAKKKKPAVKYYSVKAGTTIRVRMEDTVSSETARVGDTFKTTTIDPIYSSEGVELIPAASTVIGRITAAKRAAKNGQPGTIDVNFTTVILPNSRRAAINGFLTSLDDEDGTTSDNEGTVSAKKTKRRNLKFIGGGAAGGAIAGAAIGGGVGAVIGAGVGAVGGLVTKKYVKGKEAEVEQGAQFGVYLSKAVFLPKYN